MRLSHFFIDRPIFATVLSVFVTLIGLGALVILPVAQYPEVAPPTIVVRASYPGASSDVVANSVAAPLEQEINGVEGMLYMLSQATSDGQLAITGARVDIALPVPEPGTLSLLGTGLLSIAGLVRRKRNSTSIQTYAR